MFTAIRPITNSFTVKLATGQGGVWTSVRRMSVRPEAPSPERADRKKVTLQHLRQLHATRTAITMLTVYSYPSARRADQADIDICFVGDSLAQVALGHDNTTRLTLDEMLHHCRALGVKEALATAVRLVKEGDMEAVKLEGGDEVVDVVRAITAAGIPVMGHIGLTPQKHTSLSGYKVQGRNAQDALSIARSAKALEDAGVFAIVLEAIPSLLAEEITGSLRVPTIGIGAGMRCSGQVLVQDDALGVWGGGRKPKFVRRFAQVGEEALKGVEASAMAVRKGQFPADEEAHTMPQDELNKFKDNKRV
ncbi:ketopantoate hydroxymethyltransferase [Dacryopinax primogenitus]|uniref:3-methyl-2-oxobutanoate hydroxymethyltransferase n=1 Tax=Dacryopinax primogenitus (strain DJM 731) TaxID=1858805 RepID=M5FN76_DACPD|nr:ketopantoate hydroxymethyltransferase [Dacryopinax primogenitus]EJT96960.1 ketopantoate hydroxymethyltransferase [Dacryopinax primogenitus]